MTYFVLSVFVTAFIYLNVFGMFKGIKDIPDGLYKSSLWKYKKMEIVEKGIISLAFVAITYAMKFSDEIAMIALAAMVFIMAIEGLFGKFIRKNFVCPHCGAPIWTGNYIVLLRARKQCEHCGYHFVENKEVTADDKE